MLELFKATNNFVWGPPLLLLLVGTGVYFTIRLGLFQLSKLPTAFRLIFSNMLSTLLIRLVIWCIGL